MPLGVCVSLSLLTVLVFVCFMYFLLHRSITAGVEQTTAFLFGGWKWRARKCRQRGDVGTSLRGFNGCTSTLSAPRFHHVTTVQLLLLLFGCGRVLFCTLGSTVWIQRCRATRRKQNLGLSRRRIKRITRSKFGTPSPRFSSVETTAGPRFSSVRRSAECTACGQKKPTSELLIARVVVESQRFKQINAKILFRQVECELSQSSEWVQRVRETMHVVQKDYLHNP